MKEIAVYEAKIRLSELIAAVERGEQFTITRRGQPVARLIAVGAARRDGGRKQRVAAAMARMRTVRRGITLEGDLKSVIAEGRE